jgi:mRNA-degrading endonuclease RelE of RelBE toxin-antitoxin system
MRNLLFHPAVKKDVKGIDKPVQKLLKENILPSIAQNPDLGDELSSDLLGLRSYHFDFGRVQYRVAYSILPDSVFVHMIGKRENFYDLLKRRMEK